MAHVPIVKEDSLSQLKLFIKGASSRSSKNGSKDVVRIAVDLLTTLPVTRFAVLEHFGSIYEDKVYSLTSGNEDSINDGRCEIIEDIQESLLLVVEQNLIGWAPIISKWAIQLLGEISSKYTEKYLRRKELGPTASLNEILQIWMGCCATKSLIEITSECIARMKSTPENCVDMLIETSVKHSPYFDWVVAHIGSCFPTTIINRVLMCGLKDFCEAGGVQTKTGRASHSDTMPKFTSVVGILGHLASQHTREIKISITNLFQSSLKDKSSGLQVQGVPYILKLASSSPMVLKVITSDFIQILTEPVLNKLADVSANWYEKGEDNDSLLYLLVNLVQCCEFGAYKILLLLLDLSFPQVRGEDVMDTGEKVNASVVNTASRVLKLVLHDMTEVVQSSANTSNIGESISDNLLFLKGLQAHELSLTKMMSNAEGQRFECLSVLIKCLALSGNEGQSTYILSHMLYYINSKYQIEFFLGLVDEIQIKTPQIMQHVVESLLQRVEGDNSETSRVQALNNVLSVVTWETQHNAAHTRCSMSWVLESHLDTLTSLIDHDDFLMARTALLIFNHVTLPKLLPVFSVIHLCHALVQFLFRSLKSSEKEKKMEMCAACKKAVLRMCNFPAGQKAIIRKLLEIVLSKDNGTSVGAIEVVQIDSDSIASNRSKVELLESNRSLAGISTMSNDGVIGRGLKVTKTLHILSKYEVYENSALYIDILCCVSSHGSLIAPDALTSGDGVSSHISRFIALLLIEFVTPDVIYNGIPWPEEEFMKVTIERDLLIKKKFDDYPVLWDVFDFIAPAPGALCYCSAIVRGLLATLLAYWDSCRHSQAITSSQQYHATTRLITYMNKGDFLPAPLSYCGEMLPYLSPYEVYLVLINIWGFMKENPPVPEKRNWQDIKLDRKYLENLRPIFLSKIHLLGHLYGRFFGNLSS